MNILVAFGFILVVPNPHWCKSSVNNGTDLLRNLFGVLEEDMDRDEKDIDHKKDIHPTMPNIGYLFRGYNIMFGNPLPTEGATMDPGFRQPIFKAVYKSHKVTPDNRYLQPDGTSIQDCGGSCSMSFKTKEISDAKSYQTSLENKVSASIGASYAGFSAAFSASASFKEVQEKTSSRSSRFTQSSATCCSYLSQLLNYDKPPLTDNFINALKLLNELPAEFAENQGAYFEFIQTFGTHYIREATLGALFGQQSEISKEAWASMKSSQRSISAAAEASAYGVAVSAGYENDKQRQEASEFAKSSTNQKKFTIGAPPPSDGNVSTWVQQVHSSPAPMSLRIAPITDIFKFKVEGIEVSEAVKGNLQKALDGYCNWLATAQKNRSIVTTCSAPKAGNASLETIEKNFLQILYTSPTAGCLSMWNASEEYKAYDNLNVDQCKQVCSTATYCRSFDFVNTPNKWDKSICYISKDSNVTKPSQYRSPCTGHYSNSVYQEKKSLPISYTSKVKGCLNGSSDWKYENIDTVEQCKLLCSTFWDCRSIDYLPTKINHYGIKICYLYKDTRHTKPTEYQEPCYGNYHQMDYYEKQI